MLFIFISLRAVYICDFFFDNFDMATLNAWRPEILLGTVFLCVISQQTKNDILNA